MWTWVTVLLTCNLTWQKINDLRLVYVHFRFSLYLVLFFSLSVSISRFQRDGEGMFFWLRILEPNDLNYMSGRFWREASWPLISSRGLSLVPNQSSLLWCLFFSYMLVLHNPENCFIFSASPERMTQTLYWKKSCNIWGICAEDRKSLHLPFLFSQSQVSQCVSLDSFSGELTVSFSPGFTISLAMWFAVGFHGLVWLKVRAVFHSLSVPDKTHGCRKTFDTCGALTFIWSHPPILH